MKQQARPRVAPEGVLRLLALLLLAGVASVLLVTSASAQLPEDEPTSTPVPDTDTTIRLEVDEPAEPLESGIEIPIRVTVDQVEHMAAFDVALGFDPDKVDFLRVEDQGQFLQDSDRGENMECPELEGTETTVLVNCVTFGPPLCLDGAAGASGSGLLATVYFSSRGNGDATIELTTSTMALDDLPETCDPENDQVQAIPHLRGDPVTIPIVGGGGGGSSTGLIIGVIAGVAIAVVVVAGGGFLWLRRRAPAG
jgi:hypothetical protein